MSYRSAFSVVFLLMWMIPSAGWLYAESNPEAPVRHTLPDGSVFEGETYQGLLHGRGVLSWPNGSHYEGEFHNGLFEGQGRFVYATGDIYEGAFKRGLAHGKGVLTYRAGDVYDGAFEYGLMHGVGVLTYQNGDRYTGQFEGDLFNGEGVIEYNNGGKYEGQFRNGLFHGAGKHTYVLYEGEEMISEGRWENGRFLDGASGFWEAYRALEEGESKRLIAEDVLFNQYRLLTERLVQIEDSRPGELDIYFVSFGSDGSQGVFMREALYTKQLFDDRFSAVDRSLALINHPETVEEHPLATATNLRLALAAMAERMDVEEDVLVLYLTSHGSRTHELTVDLPGVQLRELAAEDLALLLEESGIKWKVVVISACFSGGFIDVLQDEYSMIITSASKDRTSFGCSDEAEFTYFGRAFFERALNETLSFSRAFVTAKELVAQWESDNEYEHSNPQIYRSELMKRKLHAWLEALGNSTVADLDIEYDRCCEAPAAPPASLLGGVMSSFAKMVESWLDTGNK